MHQGIDSARLEQFLLRDARGRIRVSLSAPDGESVVLTFRDRLERDRLAIGLLPGGEPLVGVCDEHRRRRAAFGVLDADAPAPVLFGEDGTSRARLTPEEDAPRFVGQAADGTVLWETPAPAVAQ